MDNPRLYHALSGASVLIALAIGFAVRDYFFPILMLGLALATLFTSLASFKQKALARGLIGACWFVGIGVCFIVGFWPWILVVVAVSSVLSALVWPRSRRAEQSTEQSA
jgi:hypothetical protein